MPTFARSDAFKRDYKDLTDEQRSKFKVALRAFVDDLLLAEASGVERFRRLCEWLDRKPLDSSNNVGLRYHPNTRAAALKACRILVGFAEHGVIDSGQAATVKP